MSIFSEIERLITEHGSAVILRERVAQLREAYDRLITDNEHLRSELASVKRDCAALESAQSAFETQGEKLRTENRQLRSQVQHLESTLQTPFAGNPKNHVCDCCGSRNLQRVGNRPNAMFQEAGIKDALYTCADCGAESAFIRDEP